MSLSVRMLTDWECPEDADRNVVRRYPKGLALEMPDDVAAVAIALGVAEPTRELSGIHRAMVDAAAAVLAGGTIDEAALEAALTGEAEPTADGENAGEEASGGEDAGEAGVAVQSAAAGDAGTGERPELVYDPPRAEPAPTKPKGKKGKG